MPIRTVYEVAPRGVECVDAAKAIALAKGVDFGRTKLPSQLLIKRADGTG